MPVSVNLYLTPVKAIKMNLRKSHLNRRKLKVIVEAIATTAEIEDKKKKQVTELQAV